MKTLFATLIAVLLISTLSFAGNLRLTKATTQQEHTYSILKNYLGNKLQLKLTCDNVYHIKMSSTKEDTDVTFATIDNFRLARGFTTLLYEGAVDDETGGAGLYAVIFGGKPTPTRTLAIVFGYTSKDNMETTYLYGECFYVRRL